MSFKIKNGSSQKISFHLYGFYMENNNLMILELEIGISIMIIAVHRSTLHSEN